MSNSVTNLSRATRSEIERIAGYGIRQARRFVILVVGSTVLLIGISMAVLPGPAFVVIPTGLAVLAVEFAWARRLMDKARRAMLRAKCRLAATSHHKRGESPRSY
jgi:uncharacterized protein (TIGR02611 family)